MHLSPKKKLTDGKMFSVKRNESLEVGADCPRKSSSPKMKWSAYHLSGSESPLVDPLSEMGFKRKRGAKKCASYKLFHSSLTLVNKTWCSPEPVSLIEVPGAPILSPLFTGNNSLRSDAGGQLLRYYFILRWRFL